MKTILPSTNTNTIVSANTVWSSSRRRSSERRLGVLVTRDRRATFVHRSDATFPLNPSSSTTTTTSISTAKAARVTARARERAERVIIATTTPDLSIPNHRIHLLTIPIPTLILDPILIPILVLILVLVLILSHPTTTKVLTTATSPTISALVPILSSCSTSSTSVALLTVPSTFVNSQSLTIPTSSRILSIARIPSSDRRA
mmetsp:Transcript_22491/g.48694  ORF Transcript_22491/g.48694 Transcript_22491/m.48694 type:complete len:202 (-) Transcript_22491:1609-2214(-)